MRLSALLFFAFASCGLSRETGSTHDVTVRRYEDVGFRVDVEARDGWLLDPTREACDRLNAAAGIEVFRAP